MRDATTARSTRVGICISTRGRPDGLRRALRSIGNQRFSAASPDLFVVVAGSGEDGSLRVVEDAASEWKVPVVYAPERRANISHSRNTAVAEALRRGAELVAFLDDDEIAGADWLQQLMRVRGEYSADAVCGPVVPRYLDGFPEWSRASALLEPRRVPTGSAITYGMTGNALVSARFLRGPQPFDPAFGETGGEDTLFFGKLVEKRARIVWADEAVVEEMTPPERGRAGWLVRRAFRVGNNSYYCDISLAGKVRRRLTLRAAEAFARIILSGVLLPPSLFFGRKEVVRVLRIGAHGLGSIAGFAGFRYRPYKQAGTSGARPVSTLRERVRMRSASSVSGTALK